MFMIRLSHILGDPGANSEGGGNLNGRKKNVGEKSQV